MSQEEFDEIDFECHRCKGSFKHFDGTWLPTGRLVYTNYMTMLPPGTDRRFPNTPVAFFSLAAPEIETSDDFTCYDCLRAGDGEPFLDSNYNVA